MKIYILLMATCLLVLNNFQAQTCKYSLNGEPPPGTEPKPYGTNQILTDSSQIYGLSFSPDGNELIYTVKSKGIFHMKKEKGQWSKAELISFSNKTLTHIMYPKFSPDEKLISFVDGNSSQYGYGDIFIVQRLSDKTWSDSIIKLPEPINSPSREAGHCFTSSGTIYFTSGRADSTPSNNIFKATPLKNGGFEIKHLSQLSDFCIETDEECLYVSPNEEYLITDSWRKRSKRKHDLFISFRLKNDEWSELKPLNSKINTDVFEHAPFVSSDHQYLFFIRDKHYYWVSTKEVFVPYLNRQIPDFYEKANQEIKIEFPGDTYKDFNGEITDYELLVACSPKSPDWLTFDSKNLILSGKPEQAATLSCILKAIDNDGNTSETEFKIIIEE